MMNNGINEYRYKQSFLHKMRLKYSNMIELDRIKRSVGRIVHFCKKNVLYEPCNISDDEVKKIPGIFRFRCYVYDIEEESKLLNEIFLTQAAIINTEQNEEIKQVLLNSLTSEINKQKECLRNSKTSLKYPIMLDLRDYMSETNDLLLEINIFFDDKLFMLDKETVKRLHCECDKVNKKNLKYERYVQMLNHSKALSKTYALDIQK